jgi:hypothetical protein
MQQEQQLVINYKGGFITFNNNDATEFIIDEVLSNLGATESEINEILFTTFKLIDEPAINKRVI